MKVRVLPSMEDCMDCADCPEMDAPPSEKCVECQSNPKDCGELIQFLMYDSIAYAVVLIEDEFWLTDIVNLRYIKDE